MPRSSAFARTQLRCAAGASAVATVRGSRRQRAGHRSAIRVCGTHGPTHSRMHAALTRVRSHSAAAARLVRLAYFLQRHTVRVCLGGALASAAQAVSAIGFEDVAARAQALAQSPHKPVASTVPPQLKALSYDQYRDIRFM